MWPLLLVSNWGIPLGGVVLKGFLLVAAFGAARLVLSTLSLRAVSVSVLLPLLFFSYLILRAQDTLTAVVLAILALIFTAGVHAKQDTKGWLLASVLIMGFGAFILAARMDCALVDFGIQGRNEYVNDVCASRFLGVDGARYSGLFVDPNHFAAACIFILLGVQGAQSSLFLLSLLVTSILLSGSRIAMVVLLLIIIYIFWSRARTSVGKIMGMMVLILPIAALFLTLIVMRTQSEFGESLGRILIWQGLYSDWLERPLLEKIVGSGTSITYVFDVHGFDHERAPHNTFLLALLQGGIVGVTLYVLLIWQSLQGRKVIIPVSVVLLSLFLDFLYAPTLMYFLGCQFQRRDSVRIEKQRRGIT